MKHVVCIGSSLKDIFLPTADGVVTETPEDVTSPRKITFGLGAKYRIEDRYSAGGGGATNASIGLARLGVHAGPYALIGGDATGMWLRDLLVKNKVSTQFLRQTSRGQTDISIIVTDRKTGERVIFVNRDLQETLCVDGAAIAAVPETFLFVSALSGQWRENYQVIERLVDKNGCELAYNPGQSNITEDVDAVVGLIKRSAYLYVNKDEAAQIVLGAGVLDEEQVGDAVQLLDALRGLGAQTVVVTDGRNGAWVLRGKGVYFAPSSGTRPMDTTGAGDAFTSASLAAFLSGETVEVAMSWGVTNAGSVVRFYGSNEGLLRKKEILAQAKAFEASVKKVR